MTIPALPREAPPGRTVAASGAHTASSAFHPKRDGTTSPRRSVQRGAPEAPSATFPDLSRDGKMRAAKNGCLSGLRLPTGEMNSTFTVPMMRPGSSAVPLTNPTSPPNDIMSQRVFPLIGLRGGKRPFCHREERFSWAPLSMEATLGVDRCLRSTHETDLPRMTYMGFGAIAI